MRFKKYITEAITWKKTKDGKQTKVNGNTWSIKKLDWQWCICKNGQVCDPEEYDASTCFSKEALATKQAEKFINER